MEIFTPAYLELLASDQYEQRIDSAYQLLAKCDGCAWHCPVNRLENQLGVCRTGVMVKISSYGPHHGEEDPLSGWRGSGTIFLTRCNLRCQFCQNSDISHSDDGEDLNPEQLAHLMLKLQSYGCHNINFVSPSHVVPQILAGVWLAGKAGLHIPLVYNTGGYDSLEMLALLNGVIDIYMPDMKYSDAMIGKIYSKVNNYPTANQAAVREMHRQVGDLQIDRQGLATRGLLVRHLILPNNLAGTGEIIRFLAEEISLNTYLNLMDQYRPSFHASRYPELNRRITKSEYISAVQMALDSGLKRLDQPQVLL